MKSLVAILFMFMGANAYAVQTQDCADTKEGVRQILESRFGEKNTRYLDKLAGTWGTGKKGDDVVDIHDSGALALGKHWIRVCPQGRRVFYFAVKGMFAGGNTGFITIHSGSQVTISGGQKEVAKANGTYVKVKKQGNG